MRKQRYFQFTRRWFRNRNLSTFQQFVMPEWAGKPIKYLEIGVFEGMSMVWMMQNVLTHPDSRAVGIDPWLMTVKIDSDQMELVCQRAMHNTEPFKSRCQLIRGNSAEVLRRMTGHGFAGVTKSSIDVCMIDGDHNELGVLDDVRLCIQLVRVGGHLLLDDVENDHQKSHHVKQGIGMFLEENKNLALLWKHRYVECYQRTA